MNDATIGQIERDILKPYPIQLEKLAGRSGSRWSAHELVEEVQPRRRRRCACSTGSSVRWSASPSRATSSAFPSGPHPDVELNDETRTREITWDLRPNARVSILDRDALRRHLVGEHEAVVRWNRETLPHGGDDGLRVVLVAARRWGLAGGPGRSRPCDLGIKSPLRISRSG